MAEIHVYFHNGGTSDGEDVSNVQATNKNTSAQKKKIKQATTTKAGKDKDDADNSMIKALVIDSAKQVILNSIGTIGDLSGNYVSQSKIQQMLSIGATAIQMLNFPIGTIGASLNLVATGVSDIINKANQNQQIALLRQRSGDVLNDEKGTKE